ncbi:MAG: nucleotide exchange factor GrpE [Clostridia bacterium]|nr:nucleotide exchange factor GrpE [Clostridia bacterium]
MEENKNIPETAEEAVKEEKKEKKAAKQDKKLLEEIEELKAKLAEQEDKYLRMAAEYDNFRRRSREEKDAIYENAMADTVKELLPIIDNLDRASSFTEGDKILEGLILISKSTASVFEKLGVEEYGKVGETFDPNIHNAVFHVDDDQYGEGEIVEVFQKGYRKGKHIIRFAMVKTAN